MTRTRRGWNILIGFLTLLIGLGLLIDPIGGLRVVAFILTISLTIRGMQSLWYYLTMARFMVDGRLILYRGMVYLDLGLLTHAMSSTAILYIVLYLAGLHSFSAVVGILGAFEAKKLGSPSWKRKMVQGVLDLLMTAVVLIGGFAFDSVRSVVYIYGIGLIYSACLRIGSAFRRNAIVYIP